MGEPFQTSLPPEETIEEIRTHIELALARVKLFRLKTKAFERHVEETGIHLESAKRNTHALK
jgi:hypothetical protein